MRASVVLVAILFLVGCGKGKPTESAAQAPTPPPGPQGPQGPAQPNPNNPNPPDPKKPTGKTPPPANWVEFRPPNGGFKAYAPRKTWTTRDYLNVKSKDEKRILFHSDRNFISGLPDLSLTVDIYFHLPMTTPAQKAEAVAQHVREVDTGDNFLRVESVKPITWLGREATEIRTAGSPNRYIVRRVVPFDDLVYMVTIHVIGQRLSPADEAGCFDNFELTPDAPATRPTPKPNP
jgi:hypothetical protein